MQVATKRQLINSTILLIGALLAAKLLSLAQTFIVANRFGTGAEWSAYTTADGTSAVIVTLIAGGSLGHAFIPIFGGFLARGDTTGAWRIASRVLNTLLILMLIVCMVMFVFAPQVARLQAPGFDESTTALTANLLRVLLISTALLSIGGIITGVLHSHNHFLTPALAPVMLDVGNLIGAFFLVGMFGIYGMVYGTVIGAALYVLIQIPSLLRHKPQFWAELGLTDPTLWRMYRLLLPRLASMALGYINLQLIGINIASRMGEDGVSVFSWGWRLMQIPETLIGTAMATVIFPTLAAQSALSDDEGKRNSLVGALKFILIATIPSALAILLIGQPAVSLLERGAFDAQDTALVYGTLQFFIIGLITHSLLEVTTRSFFADKDTVTPLFAALGGTAVNLLVSTSLAGLPLTAVFSGEVVSLNIDNVRYLGLGNSLGAAFQVAVLLVIIRVRWRFKREGDLLLTTLKTIIASLLMSAAIFVVDRGWQMIGADGTLMTLLRVGSAGLVGLIVFIAAALLLRMNEVRDLLLILWERLLSLFSKRKPVVEAT